MKALSRVIVQPASPILKREEEEWWMVERIL